MRTTMVELALLCTAAACGSEQPDVPDPTPPACRGPYPDNLHFGPAAALSDRAIPAGSAANDIVLAALHGGAPDIAAFVRAPDPGGGRIVVFRNDGGRFALESTVDLGEVVPYRGLAIDFDGDGSLDLAAYGVTRSNQVVLAIAPRTPSGFGALVTYPIAGAPLPGFITAGTPIFADLDHHAIWVATLDAATGSTRLSAVRRDGGVAAQPVVLAGVEARDVAGVDCDGDGVIELAVVDASSRLATYRGSTLLASKPLEDGDEPTQILVGDFNGDRKSDVRTLQQSCFDGEDPDPCDPGDPPGGGGGGDGGGGGGGGDGGVILFETQLDPTTREAAGDLNGDGRAELVLGGTEQQLAILMLHRDGTVDRELDADAAGIHLAMGAQLDDLSLAIGDLNGDGMGDLVVGQRAASGSQLSAGDDSPLLDVIASDACAGGGGEVIQ